MKNKSLLLHPLDPNQQPDITRVTEELRTIGFIDSAHDKADQCFLVGDNFLQLVIFLGCSPSVELSPTDDGRDFCHISFIETSTHLVTSAHTRNPRCPACRKDAAGSEEIASVFQDKWATQWQCNHCNENIDLQKLNWRHTAGLAGFFIEISNIFPDEAVPSDELMSALQKTTNSKWDYFYYYHQ